MKILFIAPRFHTNYIPYIKALKENNYSCDFIAVYKGKIENYDTINPIILQYNLIFKIFNKINLFFKKNYLHNSFELTFGSPSFIRLLIEIRKHKPNIIFIKGVQNIMTLYALIIGKILGLKTIIHIQTDIYGDNNVKKRFFIKILKKILGVVVTSPVKGDVKEYKEKFEILFLPFIHNVIEKKKEIIYNKNINIVSVGKFVKRKDHLLLLKSFLEIKKTVNNVKLTLIGEKADKVYTEQISKFIKTNNLNGEVSLFYNLDMEDVFDIYKKSDLFVLAAYNEPASVSIIEAMACGLPVISSDQNGTKSYIEEGKNGYIFKAKNKKDLTKKILNIIKNKDIIIDMGKYSTYLIKEKYSYENFLNIIKKNIK